MREIDLKYEDLRTDLIKDIVKEEKIDGIIENKYKEKDVVVSNIYIDDLGEKTIFKKKGNYTTISFDDVTDKDNFKLVEKILIKEIKKVLAINNISDTSSCLVVGLGNEKSTPDAIGPKTIENILVTNHIYETVGSLEAGFRKTFAISPNVFGSTGIESYDIIKGVVDRVKPDFLIVVDALLSEEISRVNKTIQITDTGINPGSGVGNNRHEISSNDLKIPVIAIGIPTVLDAITIVNDTINLMIKHLSYNIFNKDNKSIKLIPSLARNYLINNDYTLDKEEKKQFMGLLGTLDKKEIKELLKEVLIPVGYNLIVTVKEVDFIVEKLSLLLSNGINKSLHDFN